MIRRALSALLLIAAATPAIAQTNIPVYPGARLELKDEDACCAFVSADPLAKVIAFYEAKLGAKATTPAMKTPPGMQLRVISVNGENFEIVGAQSATRFSITAEQLGREGALHAYNFRKAKGKLEPIDNDYANWLKEYPPADALKVNLPVYPGSYGKLDANQDATCFNIVLITPDAFEKVVAFYSAKLGPAFEKQPDDSYRFDDVNFHFFNCVNGSADDPGCGGYPNPTVEGTKGAINKFVEVTKTEQKMQVVPWLDPATHSYVNEVPIQASINIRMDRADAACMEIPASAKWVPFKKK